MQETNEFNIGEKIKTAVDGINTDKLSQIIGSPVKLLSKRQETEKTPHLSAPVAKNVKGNVAGALFTVGSVGTIGFSGIMAIFSLAMSRFTVLPTVVTVIIFAVGVGLGVMAGRSFGYASRFRRYVKLLDGRAVITLSEIAASTGKSQAYIEKDLRRMIADGLFPQGSISDDGEVFALSPEAAAWYADEQVRQEASRARKAARLAEEKQNPTMRDARLAAEKGLKQLSVIQSCEKSIQDESVRDAFLRLEIVTERIVRFEQSHHERLNELKRFNNYYLPTTVKLAKVYAALEKQPDSENVRQSKQEIVDALGDIETAFNHILDNLINDVRMDVSADISVMKTMFAQDGLNDNPFEPKQK